MFDVAESFEAGMRRAVARAEDATDAELVVSIGGGDLDAVGALYDRFAATLLPLAMRVLRDRAEAEDVVHDAFVHVVDRAAQYDPSRGSVAVWLVTLTRNLAIDRTRRRERRRSIAREVLVHEPLSSWSGAAPPDALASDGARDRVVRRALAALSVEQRRVLERTFFEGKSFPEIAKEDSVPLGTIKSRAARGLAALKTALAREGMTSAVS